MIKGIIKRKKNRRPADDGPPLRPKHPAGLKRKLTRMLIYLFGWIGLAVIYYFVFSFFFDTPVEYGMKQSIRHLEEEYDRLSSRYDSLQLVLGNVADRDRNLFRTLYDADPYQSDMQSLRLQRYDSLIDLPTRKLAVAFYDRLDRFEERMRVERQERDLLAKRVETRGVHMNDIPSIQPVINNDLTRIATSFGPKIHPFYRGMVQHDGVDYAVAEGTRVFATADGTVSRSQTESGAGLTVVLTHEGGYETRYSHLDRSLVRAGARVRRGDIIGLSGNTGLSLAPHLHYEVRLEDTPVDPVYYFFHELDPEKYDRIRRLAAIGMQAFD
jgi:murein DD-endopeptidase MepM/ murein hydrolase activator NlpD